MENSNQNSINSVNELETVILPITLYAFGNRTAPRTPRANIDIKVENDTVKPTYPPTGASVFADIQYAPLTGHYYKLEQGTKLPLGLSVVPDGKDVGGIHSPTHHTIYPHQEMPFTEFIEKFLNCGWIYAGKKELR